MKVYDCFMYFDEDLVLELRLNLLDKYAKIEDFKKAYIREKNLKFV